MGEGRANWRKTAFAAGVSAMLTVAASMAVYYLTTKTPKLAYSVSSSPALSTSQGFRSIYAVTVTDAGKTELDSVTCAVTLPAGSIEDARTKINPAIPINESKSPTEYKVTVPSLNPGEEFALGLMLDSPLESDAPEVSVRARGVTAERSDREQPPSEERLLLAIAGASLGIMGVFSSTFLALVRRKRLPTLLPFMGGPFDRNEIVAHILATVGLNEESDRVRFAPSEMSFMGSADYVASVAKRDASKAWRCALALKAFLLVDRIAPGSLEVIKRNLRQLEGDAFDETFVKAIRQSSRGRDGATLRDSVEKLVSECRGPAGPVSSHEGVE